MLIVFQICSFNKNYFLNFLLTETYKQDQYSQVSAVAYLNLVPEKDQRKIVVFFFSYLLPSWKIIQGKQGMSYESIRKLFTKWIVSFVYNEYQNCEIETYKKYCLLQLAI